MPEHEPVRIIGDGRTIAEFITATPDAKPELGEVFVGRKLLVIQPASQWRSPDPVEVVVTKVGRTWVYLERVNTSEAVWPKNWRMHMQTRTEWRPSDPKRTGADHSHFRSPEEHVWHHRNAQAKEFLKGAGIQIDRWGETGRWVDRYLELANLVRGYEGLEPL